MTLLACNEAELQVNKNQTIQESGLQTLYEDLVNLPTVSLLSNKTPESRAGYIPSYPVFTPDDLKYLSTLSQNQFMAFRDSLIITFGGLEKLDSLQAANYADAFNALGGHEGIDQLISFSTAYLDTVPGWESIQALMPKKLSESISKGYIYQAAFIDQYSRPIHEELVQHDLDAGYMIVSEIENTFCHHQLTVDLCMAGIDIAADTFLDVMSGGVLDATLLPESANIFALELQGLNIWLNYEVCNHRWH